MMVPSHRARRRQGGRPRGFSARAAAALALAVQGVPASAQQCRQATSCTRALGANDYRQRFLDPSVYDKTVAPESSCANSGGRIATKVEIQLNIYSLNEVNQKRGEITVGAYVRRWWQDSRLAFNSTLNGGCYDNPVMLETDQEIWTPNLYIHNLVEVEWGQQLTWISEDGGVWESQHALLTTKCELSFHRLPFDTHDCDIEVASYSLNIEVVRLVARGGMVGDAVAGAGIIGEGVTSVMWLMEDGPDFVTPGYLEQRYGGQWDYVRLKFRLTRISKFFMQQSVVPDFMFLVLAYVGFYVDSNAAPARVALSLIPALILRVLANSVYASIPQISTNVWLCDYLLASMALCCLCTVQYGLVQYFRAGEKSAEARFASIKTKKDIVKKCLDQARDLGVPVAHLLDEAMRRPSPATTVETATEETLNEEEEVATAAEQPQHVVIQTGDFLPTPIIPRESSPTLSELEGEQGIKFEDKSDDGAKESDERDIPQTSDDSKLANVPIARPEPPATRTAALVSKNSLSEADLSIVKYASRVFKRWQDVTEPVDCISTGQIREVLKNFGLYFSVQETRELVHPFLLDQGAMHPENDEASHMDLDGFLDFLVVVEQYLLAVPAPHKFNPFSPSLPLSLRCDLFFRWFFPFMVAIKIIIFFAISDVYPATFLR